MISNNQPVYVQAFSINTDPEIKSQIYPQVAPHDIIGQPVSNISGQNNSIELPIGGFIQDPLKLIEDLVSARVSQKAQYLETFCICEFENEYTIYAGEPGDVNVDKEKLNPILKCKEHSTCCQRCWCPGECRQFVMDMSYKNVYFDKETSQSIIEWLPFVKFSREYRCTCCTYNRPIFTIDLIHNGANERLGRIVSDFACCDFKFSLYEGESTEPCYNVNGPCCQCGIHCRCPCEPCKEVIFDLYDPKNYGKKIGEIKKLWTNCKRECCSNADEYTMIFPSGCTWKQKILMLANLMFIDYMNFEKKGRKQ